VKNQPTDSIKLHPLNMKAVLVLFQFMLLLAMVFGLLVLSDDHHSGIFNGGIFCYCFMLFAVVFLTWVTKPIVITKDHLNIYAYSNRYSVLNIRRSFKLKWEEIELGDDLKTGMVLINKLSNSDENIFRIPFNRVAWHVVKSQKFVTAIKTFDLIQHMCKAQSEKAKDQIFKQFLTFGPTDEKAKKFSPLIIISSQLVLLAIIVKIY
jgi:hypothetical protein